MRPVAVENRLLHQSRNLMMLDDAEMALELIDLAHESAVDDTRPGPTVAPISSPDLLTELCSAAGMIMDRAECEALVREMEQARRDLPLAS